MFFDGSSASEEEVTERPKSAMSGLSTRRSEADFEKIDAESGTEEVENTRRQAKRTQSSSGGSWMPWSWGAKAEEAPVDTVMSGTSKDEDKGKSSGVDA
jgi:receptor expression-enhancing protein 1/2/3/4